MAKEVCVFCGEEMGYIRSEYVSCGSVSQWACKSCAREVKDLSEVEKCRRALQRGLAASRDKLEEFLAMAEGAEDARPVCQYCGEKMTFKKVVTLEKKFEVFDPHFEILPAYCGACGRIALFDPAYIRRNKTLSYLAEKDNSEVK